MLAKTRKTMYRVFSLHCLFCLSLLSFLHFSPSRLFGLVLDLPGPISLAGFFSRSSGCSTDSAPSPGAVHAGSVVDSEPPRSPPPRRVSVRQAIVFVRTVFLSVPLFSFQRSPLEFSLFHRPRALLAPFVAKISPPKHCPDFYGLHFPRVSPSNQNRACFRRPTELGVHRVRPTEEPP